MAMEEEAWKTHINSFLLLLLLLPLTGSIGQGYISHPAHVGSKRECFPVSLGRHQRSNPCALIALCFCQGAIDILYFSILPGRTHIFFTPS